MKIHSIRVLLMLAICSLLSCDPEDGGDGPYYAYNLLIENQSNVSLEILGYRTKELSSGNILEEPQLIHSISLPAHKKTNIERLTVQTPIERISFIYPGFENNVDSLVMKYSNPERGYYFLEVDGDIDESHWISNKSSLLNVSVQDLVRDNDLLIYRISQQNINDAPEL